MSETGIRNLDPAARRGKTLARKSEAKFVCEDCGQFYFSIVSLEEVHSDRCNICGGQLVEVEKE